MPATERGAPAGGWLVLDADGNGALGEGDTVARVGSAAAPVSLDASDFVHGTFFAPEGGGGRARAGTEGDDTLLGGTLGEAFIGTAGSDRIEGGAGGANALSYAALAWGPVFVRFAAHGAGTAAKAGGGVDAFTGVHAVAGTAGADTLDGAAAGGGPGFFAVSLEGGRGNDRLVGDGGHAVQATYGAGAPFAALVDLHAGTAEDGWGGVDTLVAVRRVAVASDGHDTVLGSAGDDLFLSAGGGNKFFDGRAGLDEYRYAGPGGITVSLSAPVFDGVAENATVLKPGGSVDRLRGIEAVSGGSGADSIVGSGADERLSGGAGDDTLDGAGGLDTVRYDLLSPGAPPPTRGAVVDLVAGTATDPWGGTDALRGFEHAWGSHGADDIRGATPAGDGRAWLRGLAGADTLRASAAGTTVTADHAADPGGVRADLASGTVLDGWGDRDTLVLVAHLRGSAFADDLAGGAAANWLDGGAGDDTLSGAAGADTLLGGAGDDLFVVDDAADTIVEAAGEGTDTVLASVSLVLPAEVEALALAGAAGIGGTGNALDNRIAGNSGANLLAGADGDDTLEGAAGDDTLSGGAGADALRGGAGSDTLHGGGEADTLAGDAGADLLRGDSGADSLDGGDEADTLEGGTESDTLLGGAGADALRGGAGADILFGGGDADALEGGGDSDLLLGDAGADLLSGDGGADALLGGGGADVLRGGDDPDLLLGEEGADLLDGGAGADTLDGGEGSDTLDGGAGADRLHGGAGDDLFLLDDAGDIAFEGAGNGSDTVRSAASHRLNSDVEALELTGAADIDGTGNAGANRLTGNAGANRLLGGAGADTLDGGGGGGGGAGNGGRDTLVGGAGDDVFLLWGAEDTVLEWAGEGRDTVVADLGAGAGYALPLHVEALALAGATAHGTGNDLANRLEGNAFANTLRGGAGDDTLIGGGGNDALEGGAGADRFVFDPGMGQDRVADFEPGTDRLVLRGLGVSNLAQLMATAAPDAGEGAAFTFNDGQLLFLRGVSASRLGAADVLFE